MGYSGANWIKNLLKWKSLKGEMSPLGERVADLLGELFYGIYNLDHKALMRVDWSNPRWIEFSLGWKSLATTDFDELTRLVFLAHHLSIRVEIKPLNFHYMKLLFHQRPRGKSLMECHPTLDKAVAKFKENVSLPEHKGE